MKAFMLEWSQAPKVPHPNFYKDFAAVISRVDKHANLHFVVGNTAFDTDSLLENYLAALDEILRLKPPSAKGTFLKKAVVSTTMGPGIAVDPTITRVSRPR